MTRGFSPLAGRFRHMDTDRRNAVAPHYAAMVVLSTVALAGARVAVGELGSWVQLVIVFAVVFAYRRAVVVTAGVVPGQ
jgi:hypothetical protein